MHKHRNARPDRAERGHSQQMSKTNPKSAQAGAPHSPSAQRATAPSAPSPQLDGLALSFEARDLELIERGQEAPASLRDATRALVALAGKCPDVGRFTLGDYAATGEEIAAMFRLCRAALDFAEADFWREVERETAFYRVQVQKFEALLS